jgi:diguanylate cyclase (GGDEF)-like protein
MLKEDFILRKNVFIIVDDKIQIHYCNQGMDNGIKIINKFNIINYINCDRTGDFFIDNYLIDIEKFQINSENLYHIVIERCICEDIYLPYSTYIDYHTGLYNRNLWESINNGLVKIPVSNSYSIIIIDVDNLKDVNDKMGHKFGDYTIKIVAKSIKEALRKEDMAIRYGGDEFLIILPDISKEMAKKIISRIRKRIIKNNLNKNIAIKISAGLSHGDNVELLNQVVEDADYNMYLQKRNKKGIIT